MIRKILLISLVFVFLSNIGFGLNEAREQQIGEYEKIRLKFFSLYKNKKYLEAGELMARNLDRFPNKTKNITLNAVMSYVEVNKSEKVLNILNRALEKGVFFNKHIFDSTEFSPLKKIEDFNTVLKLNEQKRALAEKLAKAKYEIELPEKYDKKKEYPLFLALHGGDENINFFKPLWKSNLLKQKFITAYLQSSQVSSFEGYHWEDLEKTGKEVKYLYDIIRAKYLINEKQILIGGFSSGGYGSLYSAFKQIFPIKGYVALCPIIPENLTVSDIKKTKKTGFSGTIITSDSDPFYKTQLEFSEKLKNEGIKNNLVNIPGMGHWFPRDFDKHLNQAIEYIYQK